MVSVGVQFAHYFQAYSEQSKVKLSTMLDKLNALMFTQPEDINKLLTQGKYFIPLATRLGMPVDQIMGFLASMGQTGFLRGKGGTGIQNTLLGAINVATMTSHLQGARLSALQDLGLIGPDKQSRKFLDASGNIDPQLLFGMLTAAGKNMESTRFIGDISNAFGKSATQFLSVFTGPAVQQQLTFIQQAMQRMGTVEKMFSDFFKDLIPQAQRFATNVFNILTNIARPVLPYLTKAFTGMANALGALGDWFAAHPKAGLATAIAGFVATAGFAAYAAKQLWILNAAIDAIGATARAQSILNGAGPAAAGGMLGAAGRWIFSPITATGAGIGALGAAIGKFLVGTAESRPGMQIYQGGLFSKIFSKSFFTVLGDVGAAFARLVAPLAAAGGWIVRLVPWIGEFGTKLIPVVGWIIAGAQALKYWMDHPFQIGEFIGKIVGWFKYHLIPDITTAVSSWVPKIVDFFKQLGPKILAGLQVGLYDVFHPNMAGGFFDQLRADWNKSVQGFNTGVETQRPTRMSGETHIAKVEMHFHGVSDPKKHAAAVVSEINKLARHALHSGSSVATVPSFSRMEFATS
jgi:hypothetical protein